ncbi:MAG: beta-galactosidase [Candidatus Ventricola sp.]
MSALLDGKRIVLGTCYYPEHWPREMWKEDLERMLGAGIEVIRIAEFAWSKTEPTEGVFTYEFFDSFLDLCEEVGMKVIFCTPTATPPAWLTHKYPEVLNCTIDGTKLRHGARRHYNYNAPIYRQLTERITHKLGEHYGSRKCIIGWQLDNEINCEVNVFYSEADSAAFRVFLQEKYGTLEALNKAWGTAFWNQDYTAWEEVHVPRKTISDSTNPHEVLDYTRFVSSSARGFAKLQADILRKYIKAGDFITTNGLFGNLDNHAMTNESLDFLTYDSYPNFAYCLGQDMNRPNDLKDRKWSRNLTETRSASARFGIMEQQSGANGWNTRMEAPTPRPGQLTLWTMQSIAHGADYISYFRWRTCTMGTEIYWHGILDYSSRENRRIREVRQVNEMVKKMAPVAGAAFKAEVAILKDYDNVWDAQLDVWHGRVDRASEKALFNAAQHSHTPIDFVYVDHATPEQLSRYKVLFYPHATIMTKEHARLLKAYVEQGGQLVFACRTGYKNTTGQCVMDKLPGMVSDLTGTDIPEYSFIAPDAGKVTIDWDGTQLEAAVFTDLLEPLAGAKCEGRYTSDYYAGSGALISNEVGKGKAYYYGTAFSEQAAQVFLEKLGVASPYRDVVALPACCELAVRAKEGREYAFILNYASETAEVEFLKEATDLLTGEKLCGKVNMPKYGVIIAAL